MGDEDNLIFIRNSKRKTQFRKEEGVVTGQFEDEEDEPIEFTKRGWVL